MEALERIWNFYVVLARVYLKDPQFYLQAGLFLLVILVAWFLARQLERAQWDLPGWHWQPNLTPFYLPLFGLLAGWAVSSALGYLEYGAGMFDRLYSLFWLLLVYRGMERLVHALLPTRAVMIRNRILFPLLLLATVLRLLGSLETFLWVLHNEPLFTIGSVAVTIPLLVLGPLTVLLIIVTAQGVRALLTDDILPQTGLSTSRAYAIGTLVSYAIVAGGTVGALRLFGIGTSTLAVLGGALTVGLGFGLQNTVNNFVSGFLLMFDPLVNVGDTVEISGERGVIRHIGIRNSLIVALDGTQVVLPNATLASSPITNYNNSNRPTKVILTLPVSIEADPRVVEERVRTILEQHEEILPTPGPFITLKSFTPGTMNFEIIFWASELAQVARMTSVVNLAIWEDLRELGYEIAPVLPLPTDGR